MRYNPPIPATPDEIQQIAIDIISAKGEKEKALSIEELQKIEAAIVVFFEKVSRRKRSLANLRRLVTGNIQKLSPAVREWMKLMIGELQKGLAKVKVREAGLPVSRLADWKYVREQGEIILKPALLSILAVGGDAVVRRKIIKQERFDPIGTEAVKWASEHTAELVVGITKETMDAIRSYVTAGINAGKSIPKLARELRPLVGLAEKQIMAAANYHEKIILEHPEYTAARQRAMADTYAKRLHAKRATLIARTETRNALWEGVFQGYGQMGIKKVEGVSGPGACDWCIDNIDGKVYTIDVARSVAAEAHPGCFVGETKVLAPGILGGYSGSYYGPVIKIMFQGGDVSVTPNHLFLTPYGFARASSLRKGDQIIYYNRFNSFSSTKNDYGKPSRIDETIAALAKSFGSRTSSVKPAADYFHGDGAFMDGDINIIRANSLLRNNSKAKGFKGATQLSFDRDSLRHGLLSSPSPLNEFLKRTSFAANSIMGSRCESFAFLDRNYLLPHNSPSFAIPSPFNSSNFKSFSNNIPRNIKKFGDTLFGFPRQILSNYRIDINNSSCYQSTGFDSIPNVSFRLKEPPTNRIATNLQRFRDFLHRFSGLVTPRDIIDIQVISHKKIPIYNLQTESSLYIVGPIVVNCECAWVAA